jgi:hypothetical protein
MAKARGSYARRNLEPTRDKLREREQHERWTGRIVCRGIDEFWKERNMPEPLSRWRIDKDDQGID